MFGTDANPFGPELRAIRSALVALVLAVLAAGFLVAGADEYGFALFLAAVVMGMYSFVPTTVKWLRGII